MRAPIPTLSYIYQMKVRACLFVFFLQKSVLCECLCGWGCCVVVVVVVVVIVVVGLWLLLLVGCVCVCWLVCLSVKFCRRGKSSWVPTSWSHSQCDREVLRLICRTPAVPVLGVCVLDDRGATGWQLAELHECAARLSRGKRRLLVLREGKSPTEHDRAGQPGEWKHSWKYWASTVFEFFFL